MWQPVLMISGYFITILGFSMLFPAFTEIYFGQENWSDFVTSSIICIFIGIAIFLANKQKIEKFTLQQGFLLTVLNWFALSFLAAFPFMFSGVATNFVDAFFEAASGITTTGASILSDIDNAPKGILMWRSILNGLGGIGIVIFAVALLPFLGVGGMQVFQTESSELKEKFMPKISNITRGIIFVYALLLTLCTISLHFAGMNWFDAVNHALSSVSTGGFSTRSASIGYYDSVKIEVIVNIFMILGSLPLSYYIVLLQNKKMSDFKSSQVKAFFKIYAFCVIAMSLWLSYNGIYNFFTALRYTSFNIASVISSTGFASTDYSQWGHFAYATFIVFSLIGGCTGSTAGGMKVFRWQVLYAEFKKVFITMTQPNRVVPIKIGKTICDNSIGYSVMMFCLAFFLSIFLLTICVSIYDIDIVTSFSAVVACITNVGPGLGDIVGPAGYYQPLPNGAKFILACTMILGRLEIFTVLVIFSKNFWKNQ